MSLELSVSYGPLRSASDLPEPPMPIKRGSNLMILYFFASNIIWINAFTPSTPGALLSDTKVTGQLVTGTVINYKRIFRLQSGKYVQVNQEDEPRNTIAIDRTFSTIVLGPQYNLQGGYFFGSIQTGKRLWRSHWNPVNINDTAID